MRDYKAVIRDWGLGRIKREEGFLPLPSLLPVVSLIRSQT